MAPGFDPYHKWLGIPPNEQPPHAYRLLGISLFEADPEVISAAADQRMAHVRTYHLGEHAAQSQALLNEIAAARLLLLNPRKKAEYDLRLRGVPPQPVLASSPATSREPGRPNPSTLPRRKLDWKLPVSLALAGMMVVAVGVLIFVQQDPTNQELQLSHEPPAARSAETLEPTTDTADQAVASKTLVARVEKAVERESPQKPSGKENVPAVVKPMEQTQKNRLTSVQEKGHPTQPEASIVNRKPHNTSSGPMSFAEVVERVEPALVRIETDQGFGSGFVAEPTGTVVTNYHVIKNAHRARAIFENGLSAEVKGCVAVDKGRDLALLRVQVKTPLPIIEVCKELPRKGEEVAAFGAPRGFSGTISQGLVSSVRQGHEVRDIIGAVEYDRLGFGPEAKWVQTTAPISNGNSGGPLVDLNGRVVAVNTWGVVKGQNLNFASASPAIIELLKKAKSEPQPLASLEPPRSRATPSNYRPHPGRPSRQQPKPFGSPRFATISLPSGSSLAATMLEVPKGWESRLFPDNAPVYVAKYSNGDVRGVHTFERGKLHGPTALLGPDGKLRLLTNYYFALRDGKVRAWNDRGRHLIYAEYSRGNKDGLYCLFQDDLPRMIQQWDKGTQLTAFLVEFCQGKPVVTSREKLSPEQLRSFAEACEKADHGDAEMSETETEVKRELVAWYRAEADRIRRERAAALSVRKRQAMTGRIESRRQADAAAREGFWRAALGRSGR